MIKELGDLGHECDLGLSARAPGTIGAQVLRSCADDVDIDWTPPCFPWEFCIENRFERWTVPHSYVSDRIRLPTRRNQYGYLVKL